MPLPIRQRVHATSVRALKPGGVFILEAYRPAHLALAGQNRPPMRELLFDAATARAELDGLDFELCQDASRHISEGRFHEGPSATVQVLAVRP